ncbi:hypothetical protein SLEP1_g8427 [Rubroshorea leprosula]|uniref:Rhamnogalacturonan lyase domain-containing protein n=1 Tax=Rubroshorea leprosula TaxID=152421 RepID=A0AAV5IBG3_9ROSI|nr:hypothetical protein SLEP1_g8427 [Rubroshorea leprosula]
MHTTTSRIQSISGKCNPRTNLGHATQGPLAVQLTKENEQVVIDNGLVRVTLSTPDGYVTGIQYNGVENVLDGRLDDNDRGYWDVVWNGVNFDKVATSNFKIVTLNDDQAELSFSKTWTSSNSIVPLNVDRRVIVRRGLSGIYLYSIMEKLAEFPTVEIDQIRVVFKLQKWFNYMAISDSQQRIMPVAEDRDPGRCETLGYKEAVLYRQYGLWERYAEIYPHNDLVFTVGVSNYARDWFYAHVTRNLGDGDYKAATWQIVFHLQHVLHTGNYTLQLALASASYAKPQVRFNDPNAPEPDFETPGRIGSDNAIARHGIHGLYRFYSIQVPSNKLRKGTNTIYLTQALNTTPFQGVMYDYIRFEEPGQ